jgi:UDP-3-O-[3-hydroxymyristoyl] glucosamine N-acyltransferase
VTFTVDELAARVGGEVSGDGALRVAGVAPLEDAGPDELSFFANKKYRKDFERSRAGVVVVEPGVEAPPGRTVLRVVNAYLAFAKISTLFHPARAARPGVHPAAVIHPGAKIHPTAEVMPLATVAAGAVVGARAILFPGVHVAEDARVGEDSVLYENVVVRERCVVGRRVILQAGCVVGGDGFGFAFDLEGAGEGPRHYKVPQSGIVVIEDDVEIGANSCVDRATLGTTRIGRGSKIDNLVQIGHNVELGPLCIVVSQVGIAGSARLGTGVVVGGQAGIVGHLDVGDGVRIAAKSGVMTDVAAGETVSGSPSMPHSQWLRNQGAFARVADLRREIRQLRRDMDELAAALRDGKRS